MIGCWINPRLVSMRMIILAPIKENMSIWGDFLHNCVEKLNESFSHCRSATCSFSDIKNRLDVK